MKKTDRKNRPRVKPNRVRVFRCHYCQGVSPLQRKSPGEDVALSTCHSCFRAVLNHDVETWLEDLPLDPFR